MPAERSRGGRRGPARAGRVPGLILVALLLGLVGWSVAALQPPAPAPADAPADEFSAARAFAHVQQIAAQTHVAGSAADGQVVSDLVATLTGLGLDTRVQNAVGAYDFGRGSTEMARVRNVVGFLKGSDSTGRLYLMAHHDSVENGPGGNDDARRGVDPARDGARADRRAAAAQRRRRRPHRRRGGVPVRRRGLRGLPPPGRRAGEWR